MAYSWATVACQWVETLDEMDDLQERYGEAQAVRQQLARQLTPHEQQAALDLANDVWAIVAQTGAHRQRVLGQARRRA
jgi:hypothetical protein